MRSYTPRMNNVDEIHDHEHQVIQESNTETDLKIFRRKVKNELDQCVRHDHRHDRRQAFQHQQRQIRSKEADSRLPAQVDPVGIGTKRIPTGTIKLI